MNPLDMKLIRNLLLFRDSISALKPPHGSIHRGWNPYPYPNTNEGYQEAKLNLVLPLDSLEIDLVQGRELYGILLCSMSR